MAYIAKIAVAAATYAIDRPYDYLVPPELTGTLCPGMRAAVPFGAGNRTSDGIVLSCQEGQPPEKVKLKYVLAQLDEEPMMDTAAIQLALWMRDRYFCTVYDAARIMLPAGLWFELKDCWRMAEGVDREQLFAAAGECRNARRLAELLLANDGWAELGQIRLSFGTADPNPAIRQLAEAGVITRETSAARGIGDKTEQIASLAVDPTEAMAQITPKRRRAPLQYAAVEALCAVGRVAAKELCYFTGASMATLRALERAGLIALTKQEVYRRPSLPAVPAKPPEVVLNEEQQAAFDELAALSAGGPAAALLYGVTGSGKTLVYLKLIRYLLGAGRSVIVLVPEIALTPQLMERFLTHFGEQVALLHSGLSTGERCDEWKRVRRGEARLVVGTRSAVFAPVRHLGAIILDEEQEPSYKSEQNPRYHARDVAKYRCIKENALLVMGSATPSVETMYHAKTGDHHLIFLRQRYNEQALPAVHIVDMKGELRAGNGGCVSRFLLDELRQTVDRGEQAILFLNRRGASRLVTCGECGQIPACPRCSVNLTYHSANRRLMCHYCGHSEPLPERCPVCGGLLRFVGAGTQKAEEELRELLPGVEILRMDTDAVSATNSYEVILDRFRKRKASILLGTQMVAKGLDFENVTLVGVLAADQMLYAPDYRAGERAFSLLTQVVGRAGRGSKSGRALIQTFTPDNDVIRCAARQDYDAYYEQEIRMRQLRDCPPFDDLLMIHASGLEETAVLRACMRLRTAFTEAMNQPKYAGTAYRLLGPAPAAVAKVNDRYRYRLMITTKNTAAVRQLTAHLLRRAMTDKENRSVSFFADFDPID